ncbi:MAG: DUF2085 domain-containing protein [Acidobacteria bacterium]|nr:DUF2085 domain-containing protein [Acidobacteriota bacterium]
MKRKASAALIIATSIWCLTILIAPFTAWSAVYDFFSHICHQDPVRSWHLFGNPLPVCIRCTSIYFAFLAALCLNLRTNAQWLRIALALMIAEFVFARLVSDIVAARVLTGLMFGAAAAPFVKQGIGELSESL